jgi:hypothetical protein
MPFTVTAATACFPSGLSFVGAMRKTYCDLFGRGTYGVPVASANAFRWRKPIASPVAEAAVVERKARRDIILPDRVTVLFTQGLLAISRGALE